MSFLIEDNKIRPAIFNAIAYPLSSPRCNKLVLFIPKWYRRLDAKWKEICQQAIKCKMKCLR